MKFFIDIYGVSISVEGLPDVCRKLMRDFTYFISGLDKVSPAEFTMLLHGNHPDYSMIPAGMTASFYHPEFVQYDHGDKQYTDYNGSGLAVFEPKAARVAIFSEEPDFLHEICYLAILSLAGAELEKKGYKIAHALTFSYRGRGVILPAPSGGGKSTLFLELIKNDNIKYLSDDTALIDKSGRLYPFPLRVGLREGHPCLCGIEPDFIYEIKRRKYGRKILIESTAFSKSLSGPAYAGVILCGKRWSSEGFRYKKISRLTALAELFKSLVVGVGLPQVIEYMNMRIKPANCMRLFLKVCSRSVVAMRLAAGCRCYNIYLGRDAALNSRGIIKLLDKVFRW